MKKIALLTTLFISLLLSSCEESNPIDDYPKNLDVEFIITSTKTDDFSRVTSTISNGINEQGSEDLNIVNSSYSNTHLPYSKTYINQTIKYSTNLLLEFTDNSSVTIGQPFDSYSIELIIKVNGEVVANKVATIAESGKYEYLIFDEFDSIEE